MRHVAVSPSQLQAEYCLVEPWVAPCELDVQNTTLLIVSIFCLVKAVVCLISIMLLRHEDPLITPGDAIESFISSPDPHTDKMCWATRRPERRERWWKFWRRRSWGRGPRRWKARKRRLGTAVPWYIWAFTYMITVGMLGYATANLFFFWNLPYNRWYVCKTSAPRQEKTTYLVLIIYLKPI